MNPDSANKRDGGLLKGHERWLAVLGFHKIGSPPAHGWETWFYISAATFEQHLRWLQESDWHVLSADELLRGLECPGALPDRSVVLTFDDGYRSMCDVTLPLLQSFGFPAVLFVPTGFVGLVNSFDAGIEPEEPICDWGDLLHLQSNGVSIQSHSVTHRRFSTLREMDRDHELNDSKAMLEERMGRAVELFSYPYGDDGGDGQAIVLALRRAGYKAGCLFGGGVIPVPVGDVYKIDRIKMGPQTDLGRVLERV